MQRYLHLFFWLRELLQYQKYWFLTCGNSSLCKNCNSWMALVPVKYRPTYYHTHFMAEINFFFASIIAHKFISFGVLVQWQSNIAWKYCTTTRQRRVLIVVNYKQAKQQGESENGQQNWQCCLWLSIAGATIFDECSISTVYYRNQR